MLIAIPLSTSESQYLINQAYVDYIEMANYTPFIIPQTKVNADTLKHADGLILPGGIDIDPTYYGEDNDSSYGVDFKKDAFERALFYAALDRHIPIFGICRGFQLIVRELMLRDKKMTRHLEFFQGVVDHQQTIKELRVPRDTPTHFVEFYPELLYGVEGPKKPERMAVNSMHHQALFITLPQETAKGGGTTGRRTGNIHSFRLAAWTRRGVATKALPFIYICEAFRLVSWESPILAVQWHPEELKDVNLLRNFFGNTKAKISEKKSGDGGEQQCLTKSK